MSRRLITLAIALAAIATPLAASAQYSGYRGASTVRCESDNNRTQLCRIDTRGGVRLVRQESNAPCIRGRSWGYDQGGIWVAQGCRARFEVGGGYAARSHGSRYGSAYNSGYGNTYGGDYGNGYGYRSTNPLAAVIGAVLGSGSYNSGSNGYYGSNNGYYGSNNGYYGNNGGYYGGTNAYYGRQPQVFKCESENGQPRFCRLPFQAQRIDLRRQLSRTNCAEGYNWGRRHDGVWVERGCRAEFVVY